MGHRTRIGFGCCACAVCASLMAEMSHAVFNVSDCLKSRPPGVCREGPHEALLPDHPPHTDVRTPVVSWSPIVAVVTTSSGMTFPYQSGIHIL